MLCILMQSMKIAMIIFTHTCVKLAKLVNYCHLSHRAVFFSLCSYSISHVDVDDTKEHRYIKEYIYCSKGCQRVDCALPQVINMHEIP